MLALVPASQPLHGQELSAGSYHLRIKSRCYHWPLGSRNGPGSGEMAMCHQGKMEIIEQLKMELLTLRSPFLV